MLRNTRPLATAGLTVALIISACSSAPSEEQRAAARDALLGDRTNTAAGRTTDAAEEPGADSGATTDETGAASSSGGGGPRPKVVERALTSIPDDGLRFQLTVAYGLVAGIGATCDDLAAWTAAVDEAATVTATAAATASDVGGDWLETPEALTIADAFRDALVLQKGCEDGAGSGDVEASLAAAGRAAAANDDLRVALAAANPATASEFWYHADQIGHTIEIDRVVREEGPIEVLIIGSSTAKRGFDPVAMTAEMGSTMNAGVAGLFPTTMAPWTDLAIGLAGDPATVVIGVATFQDFLECTDDRQQKMTASTSLQQLAFEPIAALAEHEPAQRLVGGASATYTSAVLDEYTPLPGTRGQMKSPDDPNPDSVTYYTRLYTPRMDGAEYCDQNAPAIERLVRSLVEDGREVLVVSLPLSPAMAALHPDGRGAHDRSLDGYRQVSESAGAAWLDLTDLLADDEFLDLTHATAPGRVKITAATIEALS